MSLFDILACPTCKVPVMHGEATLTCSQCETVFPIVDGVPVMFPDGSIPEIVHEADLQVRSSYNPWVHRVILQSLLDDQIVVDIGAGNMALDDPCIIRMDVTLSPYVDLVADAHALPFLPGSLDYIFSLAVFEHLRNPFEAAREIFDALKDGGYIYHECNFVFAYHGYPHHYFNATLQGMEQIFSQFIPLRKGVAPYQMPSFALQMVLQTYLNGSRGNEYTHGRRLTRLLHEVLDHDLMEHDIYFTEEAALQVAAGTYFSGFKQETPTSTLIPPVIRDVWREEETVRARYPNIHDLTTTENVLVWAKTEGYHQYAEIQAYLDGLEPFNKNGATADWNRRIIEEMEFEEPKYGAIGFDPEKPLEDKAQVAERRYQKRKPGLRNRSLALLRKLWMRYRDRRKIVALRTLLNDLLGRLSR